MHQLLTCQKPKRWFYCLYSFCYKVPSNSPRTTSGRLSTVLADLRRTSHPRYAAWGALKWEDLEKQAEAAGLPGDCGSKHLPSWRQQGCSLGVLLESLSAGCLRWEINPILWMFEERRGSPCFPHLQNVRQQCRKCVISRN